MSFSRPEESQARQERDTLDCQSCGACCRGWDVDVERADSVSKILTKEGVYGPLMRVRKGSCIALKGTIGSCVSCQIYDSRPRVCRDFNPGEADCLFAREREGIK